MKQDENNLVTMLIREIKETMNKFNIRTVLRDSMKPLDSFTLFQNPVVVDYPDLKQQYEAVIEFPCSLSEIKQRLSNRSGNTYTHIGDVFCDLCLTISNAMTFNKSNTVILEQVRIYSQAVLGVINDIITKYNQSVTPSSAVALFDTPDDMINAIFKYFTPGKLPKCLNRKKSLRSPYYDEVQELVQRLEQLPPKAMAGCISALMLELETACDESGRLVIDFSQLKPASYWWFDGLVQETYVMEHRAGRIAQPLEPVS